MRDPSVAGGSGQVADGRGIVFLDPSAPFGDALAAGVTPSAQIAFLTASESPIGQIAEVLERDGPFAAVHIVTHGRPGELHFAAGVLTLAQMDETALGRVGAALAPGASVQLWSCDVGKGRSGADFIEALAIATGADVAAASYPIGAATRGGRWSLDMSTGPVDIRVPFGAATLSAYQGLLSVEGQLWYLTQGGTTDARLNYINDDGTGGTTHIDNSPTTDLGTGFPEDVALDTAAGLYFVLSGGGDGSNSRLLVGSITSPNAPSTEITFDLDGLAYAIHVDPVSQQLYVSYLDIDNFGDSTQGILVFDYNPATGDLTPAGGTILNSFIATQATAQVQSSVSGGIGLFIPRDFDIDFTNRFIYIAQHTLGDGAESNQILRIDLNNPTAPAVAMVPQAQFPLDGDGSDFTTLNGIIVDVEVDSDSDRVFFTTHAENVSDPNGEDAIWMIANASTANGTANAVKVTLTGVGFDINTFYPGDMVLDEVNNILYVESEQIDTGSGADDDVILVFQLSADGLTATLIDTIIVGFTGVGNIGGMAFNLLANLGSVTGTSTHAVEQTGNLTLLVGAPTITDLEGSHLASATLTVSGSFVGSGDQLSISGQTSGLIAGTNITITITTDVNGNQKLTLSGYDTMANYEIAMSNARFQANGDNPTNYAVNTTRTLTWQVNDGAAGNPVGNNNVAQTVITIDAVNDAPVLGNVAAAAAFIENDAATTLSAALTSTDPDNINIDIATISITAGLFAGDVLSVAGQTSGLIAGTNITATYNPVTGVLTLLGTDTLATYQSVLRQVQFQSTSDNPTNFGANTTRTISWQLNDGEALNNLSSVGTTTVTLTAVNDAPVLGAVAAAAAYTENDTGTTLSSALTSVDPDNTTLSSATVQITGGLFTGDVLSVNGATSGLIAGTNITISYNAGTGLLTLSGSDTLANYQAALRQVQYLSTSEDPTNSGAAPTRTISWQLNDGSGSSNLSAIETTTITVTGVDDPTVLQDDGLSTDENTVIGAGLNVFNDNGSGADVDLDDVLVITAVNGVGASVGNQITLPSGALLTLNSDGTFSCDPNGAFDLLPGILSGASNQTAIDTFTYTVGGSTATVSVTVSGVDSHDLLEGSPGDDTLNGGIGNDIIHAFDGTDILNGEDGNDTLIGGAGADFLNGGIGIDTASYVGSNAGVTVSLLGNFGIGGHAAGDTFDSIENLIGSSYADSLTGDNGDNVLEGGAGADALFGGGGRDTASYFSSDAAVNVMLGAVGSGGHAQGDTYSSIENLAGSDGFGDTLTGTADANVLHGYGGDDILNGLNGDDTIFGGDGDDIITGARGADYIDGGNGNDTANYSNSGTGVYIVLGSGIAYGGHADGDTLINIENLSGSNSATSGDSLTGSAGDNVIHGNGGDDIINGLNGDDSLFGGDGNDTITGGRGADLINGGDGIDTAVYSNSGAAVNINLAAGTASGGHATGDVLTLVENLIGSAHGDTLIGDGEANRLEGLAGADILDGGAGDDTLVGGADADIFRFSMADFGSDLILDFEDGLDLFDLTGTGLTFNDFVMSEVSGDTVLTYTDTNFTSVITVAGVANNLIDASDFV
ncbi:MAG: DUF4347 domain-containing protein [Mesorhizobium sp.]|nr:DUF4347 domain-containing protein [Mesorhizobium sp.]